MFRTHIRFRAYIKEKFQEVVLVMDNSVVEKHETAEAFYKAIDHINNLYPAKSDNKLCLGTTAKLIHKLFLDEYTHTADERRACILSIEISDKDDHHLVYIPEGDV